VAKILIVEDDTNAAKALRGVLSGGGHNCGCLASGKDVVAVAERDCPDLLLLDVMLPGTSGFEICRRIRRHPELYTLPILIVSAMRGEEEVSHGLAQGADDYIVKPFETQHVLQHVNLLLRNHAASQGVDELTKLPCSESSKREIQRRISTGESFVLGCVELTAIREYARKYGADARSKAIRHVARGLVQCGEQLEKENFFLGHMGGGYFMCILEPDDVKTYFEKARKLWREHILKLHLPMGGRRRGADPETQQASLPDVLMCATMRTPGEVITPQQMFDTLAQLRQKALAAKQGGLYLDRRSLTS